MRMLVQVSILVIGGCAAVTIGALVWKAIRADTKPETVESEQAGVVSLVAYAAQHQPGISVGDWTDDEAVDPMYDALEAIRPEIPTTAVMQ